jgi:hypothetical protein
MAPALGSRSTLVKYSEWFNYLRAAAHPALRWRYALMQDYVKYASSPVNGIAQCVLFMHKTQRLLAKTNLRVPLISLLSMDDETISPRAFLKFVRTYAGRKEVLLYARQPTHTDQPYITYRCSEHPDLGIVSQSHLGLQIAADNPHYGEHADSVYYKHYGLPGLRMGKPLYSGSTLQWKSRVGPYARLQYNPDFAYAMHRLLNFFDNQ